MMTMNGTNVASRQPVPKNARKRPRIASSPPPAQYSPSSSSSPSSRVTKANKSKRSGTILSLSSSSSTSLATSALRKAESSGADLTAPASISPTENRDEPVVSGQQHPVIKWEYPVPNHPNHNEELAASVPRDHFALSSTTLPQTLDFVSHNLLAYNSEVFVPSNPSLPMCHQPASSYPPVPQTLLYENPPRDRSLAYSGVTAYPFSPYPLHQSFEPMSQPNLIVDDQPYRGDNAPGQVPQPFEPGTHYLPGSEANRMDDQNDSGWLMVNLEQPMDQQPVVEREPYDPMETSEHHEPDTPGLYDDKMQRSDFQWREIPAPEENTLGFIGHPIVDEIAADVGDSSPRQERRHRTHLSGEARTQTSKTRKLKACIRCRMQKIRCDADPMNEDGECLKCQKVNLDSKKVVHRLPCLRWKLAEVVLYREGGLGLTKRWSGVKMKDLGPRDWQNDTTRTITVRIACRQAPLKFTVRKFTPVNGDVTWRYWVDGQGVRRRIDIEPYALANVWETSRQYSKYVTTYALVAVAEYAEDINRSVDILVRKTYNAALECHRNLIMKAMPHHKGAEVNHLQFLTQYFCLWFATRNMLGSAVIIGDEKLDMEPVSDVDCPHYGKIFIPRMIPAQLDSIGHNVVLSTLRKQVLDGLWKMMASKNPGDFFIIYVTVFMLLHEVSITSRDRFRRGREVNDDQNRHYDLESFVERHQEGANIILSHWHYYKRDLNLMLANRESKGKEEEEEDEEKEKEKEKEEKEEKGEKKKADRTEKVWSELDSDEAELIAETKRGYEQRVQDQDLAPMRWEDDLYFVSQMLDEGWKPRDTFRAQR
ncbi:hypothetical protein F5Y02DRAFT_387615 [Annulohypoxylon stygium]|nr:hypothetical protein F5Y02DRAFT_387615 [Annulohypoxylon stygium]